MKKLFNAFWETPVSVRLSIVFVLTVVSFVLGLITYTVPVLMIALILVFLFVVAAWLIVEYLEFVR